MKINNIPTQAFTAAFFFDNRIQKLRSFEPSNENVSKRLSINMSAQRFLTKGRGKDSENINEKEKTIKIPPHKPNSSWGGKGSSDRSQVAALGITLLLWSQRFREGRWRYVLRRYVRRWFAHRRFRAIPHLPSPRHSRPPRRLPSLS